jgi:dihydrofolate reductase
MTPHRVGLIWAQTRTGVIGANDTIPWHIPEDIAHFREITMGHPVIMGRKTWDSLPDKHRPLTGRRNIVITRDPDWAAAGAERAASVPDALARTAPDPAWVIGGSEIYRAAMGYATELEITLVHGDYPGDTLAPPIDPTRFRLAEATDSTASRNGRDRYQWRRYTRID